jgi:hypothetical protein
VPLPDDAGYYLCGPIPFMQAVCNALIGRGVPARDIKTRCSDQICGRPTTTEPVRRADDRPGPVRSPAGTVLRSPVRGPRCALPLILGSGGQSDSVNAAATRIVHVGVYARRCARR